MQSFVIDHSTLESEFVNHLFLENNRRTILTGRFGSGKSTFLSGIELHQATFSRNDIYIKILPVNYSIASNDDVFDLIKYDLIIELLDRFGGEIELSPYTFPFLLTAQMFVMDRLGVKNFLSTLSSTVDTVGEFAEQLGPVAPFFQVASKLNKPITSLIEEYQKFKSAAESNKDSEAITSFMNDQESKKAHHLMDHVSLVIKDIIEKVKQARGSDSKTILIVDDMDRLDPEHIFRLFNIFSASYDPKDDSNKFGFDKIVFVCDLDNVREIFFHRYGRKVDFTGYIDKFYTLEPFIFDNRKYVADQINHILLGLPINSGEESRSMQIENRGGLTTVLNMICLALLKERLLNLRMLNSFPPIDIRSTTITFRPGKVKYGISYDFFVVAHVLRKFYGGWDDLSSKLALLSKYNSPANIRVLFPSMNFGAFCDLVAEMCFTFVVDHNSEPSESATGNKIISSIDGQVIYDFRGPIEENRGFANISASGERIAPISLIQLALKQSLEIGVLQ